MNINEKAAYSALAGCAVEVSIFYGKFSSVAPPRRTRLKGMHQMDRDRGRRKPNIWWDLNT